MRLDKTQKLHQNSTMSLKKRINVELARIVLLKILKRYHRFYGSRMPIILVTGTVGKSSQTLMLKTLFENDGWFVFTGTSRNKKSFNSITGLTMSLAGFSIDFEGGAVFLKKAWFIFRALWFVLFESYAKLSEKTILIYEVGYDHQNESFEFSRVFENGFDLLLTTSVTYEHTAGFKDSINNDILWKVTNLLPQKWLPVFEDEGIDTRLKNIALEQFHLIEYSDDYIIPAAIGIIDNWVMDSMSDDQEPRVHYVKSERGDGFALIADDTFVFSKEYILPHTFASSAYILNLVAQKYRMDTELVAKTVNTVALPNGRFSLLEGILNSVIIDSTYNSDPQSMDSLLNVLEEVVEVSTRVKDTQLLSSESDSRSSEIPKHYLIFGEMRELGEISTLAHQEILQRLIELGKSRGSYIENIYLVGSEWLKCDDDGVVKVQDNVSFISYKNQLFKVFSRAGDVNTLLNKDTIRPNSWFWLKGSQNTIFLEIVAEHLLCYPNDADKLPRRGKYWDRVRQIYK